VIWGRSIPDALLQRRYFHTRLDQECQRARRTGGSVSVAVLSLDGLSDVRAEGRAASGDAAMQALSAHVAARLRAMDIGCRIGEDELAAILPEVEGIDAFRVGERLRASLREDPMLAGAFTLSVGVASFPDQAAGADELAAHARSAMAWARLHDGDRTFLFHREAAAILDAEQQRRAADEESLLATLLALADSVDARHASGGGHSERVGRLAEAMAAELGFPAEHCARVGLAGRLHDLGKAGMRREIVVAEGPLSEGDITELRRHPEIGGRMLGGCALEDLVPWVRHHHERADGDGFPDGLVGDCIPLGARIIAAADRFDRLVHGTASDAPLSVERALARVDDAAGPDLDAGPSRRLPPSCAAPRTPRAPTWRVRDHRGGACGRTRGHGDPVVGRGRRRAHVGPINSRPGHARRARGRSRVDAPDRERVGRSPSSRPGDAPRLERDPRFGGRNARPGPRAHRHRQPACPASGDQHVFAACGVAARLRLPAMALVSRARTSPARLSWSPSTPIPRSDRRRTWPV